MYECPHASDTMRLTVGLELAYAYFSIKIEGRVDQP